jgi:hypothetical protein
MMAPPLTPPRFDSEPKVISNMPMKITPKAMKNSHVANEKRDSSE